MITGWAAGAKATGAILAAIPLPAPTLDPTGGDGVYRPSVDSALLCRHTVDELAARGSAARVIEMCAGSGIASMYAALAGATVTAVDDRPEAIIAVAANAARNALRIATVLADVRTWTPRIRADVIVANPPYVPAPPGVADGHAWNAGADGRAVLDPIIDNAYDALVPGGALVLVQSSIAGVAATLARATDRGYDAEIVEEIPLEFGPVMQGRTAWLVEIGAIGRDQRVERLVVVRAVRRSEAR